MIETDAQSVGSPGGTLTRDSLLMTVRGFLKTCKTGEELFTALFEFCFQSFQPLAARCDFRANGHERLLLRHDSRIVEETAADFDLQHLQPANAEIRSTNSAKPTLSRIANSSPHALAVVSAPLVNFRTGQADGAISLIVPDDKGQAVHVLSRLDGIVALVSAVANPANELIRTDRDLAALHNLANCNSVPEFAYGIVNSLCNRLQCEQVGFGVETHQRIDLLAISGLPKFKANAPGITIQRQAMEECLDAGRAVCHQSNQQDEVFPIHRSWSADTGASSVLSIPLVAGDETIGVISLRRSGEQPFGPNEIDHIANIVRPYGTAVRLLQRATAPAFNSGQKRDWPYGKSQ